jgi:hypothetical protein
MSAGIPVESLLGGLLSELSFAEPGELVLVLQPGTAGSKKKRGGDPLQLRFSGVENPERVKRFFFRQRWKPFGEWQDQVVGVSRRPGGMGIEFANAGRVRVQARAITISIVG